MKVLAIAKTLEKGGAATGARNTIDAIRSVGVEVVALEGFRGKQKVLRTAERIYERTFHGADVHCVRFGPPSINLQDAIEMHRPDVVQLFDISGNTVSFEDLSSASVPIVHRMSDFWPYNGAHHYSERPDPTNRLEERLLRRSVYSGSWRPDLAVAPSHWLADRLQGGAVKVIRNAVEFRAGVEPRFGFSSPLRLGFVANPVHDPRKGVGALSPVLDALAAQIGPIELHLFGRGSERGIPTSSSVAVHPHKAFQKDAIQNVYDRFDILLCPSRQDNSPNVLTEALSFAVPVVAQLGTGMDSYVEETFGTLVDFYRDAPEEAASAIVQLVSKYRSASAAALQFARHELAPHRIGGEYVASYRKLIANLLIM